MIILEGTDNSGKTTLAKKLADDFGLPINHSGGPASSILSMAHRYNEILTKVTNDYRGLGQINIYDRIPCISDPIYAQVFNRSSYFLQGMFLSGALHRLYHLPCDPLIIYCKPSDDKLLDLSTHVKKEHDTENHDITPEKQLQLINEYDKFFNVFLKRFKPIRYNYETDDYKNIYSRVLNYLDNHSPNNESESENERTN